jgi:hypothetical protein
MEARNMPFLTKWWEYAILAGVIFLLGAGGGYKTGSLFMQAKDAGVVEAAQQAIAKHDADVADAEKVVREQVTKEKDNELAFYKAQYELSGLLLAEARKQTTALQGKLAQQQHAIEQAKTHDKASSDFLNTPIPDYLRNHGVPSKPADTGSAPGHGGS